MEVARHLVGPWLLFVALWVLLVTWVVRRLWKRWHEMALASKLTASFVAAPVALGALGTLYGLATASSAIIADPSKKEYLLAAGLDGAFMCTAFTLVFCLFHLIFFSKVTENPETRRRRLRGRQTRGSSPPER
jgi:hypothetical protein